MLFVSEIWNLSLFGVLYFLLSGIFSNVKNWFKIFILLFFISSIFLFFFNLGVFLINVLFVLLSGWLIFSKLSKNTLFFWSLISERSFLLLFELLFIISKPLISFVNKLLFLISLSLSLLLFINVFSFSLLFFSFSSK